MERKPFEQDSLISPNSIGQILSVAVFSPNGGEQFQAGQQVAIQWQSTGATNQRVQYSLDGVNFTPIVTGLAGNVMSTVWTIPSNIVPAGQMQVTAVVRVIARNDNTAQEVMDDSNGVITIRSTTPPPTLSVQVISPNGGEQLQAGQQVMINWQSSGATNQRVQYSVNGGAFTPIITGLAGNVMSTVWTIPSNIVPAGQTQVTAVVRVIARNDNTGQEVMDDSNGVITIRSTTPPPTLSVQVISPNGGEQLQAGQQVMINWQSSGATNQRVQYSVNGGAFTPIITGLAGNVMSTVWTIPSNIVPAGQTQVTAVVRVIARNDNTGQEVMDDSNGVITIRSTTPPPTLSVQVISPNGGEQLQAGQQVMINWQSSGATNQRVQYSVSGGAFTPIITGLAGNVMSTVWTIPSNIVPAGQMQVTAVVRVIARNDNTAQEVTDNSNGLITIRSTTPPPTLSVQVISPNGGEQFQAGQQVMINWQSSGATNQRVQYSVSGGAFTPIITGLAGNVMSTVWTIPSNIVPAGQTQVTAVVRVIARNDNTGQEVMDNSNGLITITATTTQAMTRIQRAPSGISPQVGNCVTEGFASITSGQKAKYCEGVVVVGIPSLELIPDVQVQLDIEGPFVEGLSTTINPNPVRTCEPGETSGCTDFVVSLQTMTNVTLPGAYEFDLVATCLNYNCPDRTVLTTLTLQVETPRININITPNTPKRREVFAGERAQYSVDIQKSSYLGLIHIEVDLPDSIIIGPADIEATQNPTGMFTRTVEIQTFGSRDDLTFFTPPGEYSLRPKVKTPTGAIVMAEPLQLKITITPDIRLFVSAQTKTVRVGVGTQAAFTLFLFRFNFAGQVDLSVGGQPPSTVGPQFVMVPNSTINLPNMVGTRTTYGAIIDVPLEADDKPYNLFFAATGPQGPDMIPLEDQSTATLDVKIDEIKLTPVKDTLGVLPGGNVTFEIKIDPRKVDLHFFTKTVSDPRGHTEGDLILDNIFGQDPVPFSASSVKLTVAFSTDDEPGNYVFRVGARRVGGSGAEVTKWVELTVSAGQPQIILTPKQIERHGQFPSVEPFNIKVDRINYTKPLQLEVIGFTPDVAQLPVRAVESSFSDIESKVTIAPMLLPSAPEGTYQLLVVNKDKRVKADQTTLFFIIP